MAHAIYTRRREAWRQLQQRQRDRARLRAAAAMQAPFAASPIVRQGADGDPVQLDPWQLITEVGWPGPTQFHYEKHVKYSGVPNEGGELADLSVFPPVGYPGVGDFTVDDIGPKIISNSETISLEPDGGDGRVHAVVWATFNAPTPDHPLPTDDQFVGYTSDGPLGGATIESVLASYNEHGALTSVHITPR